MDLLFALLTSFVLLIVSVVNGVFIVYPLFCTLIILSLVLMRKGFSIAALGQMAIQGSRKAWPVFSILLLIGAVTSTWMAAGTVPAIVYYGIQLINPHWFILASFLLTSLVSVLIGTSFGAASTIGLALMIMAKGGEANPHLVAGAVIAGAYVGDRCSPMSSSAHLVAAITGTDLYANLKNMVKTGLLPFGLACLLYAGLSWLYPVATSNRSLTTELKQFFDLNGLVLLPALMILVLALCRVEVKRSMLISTGVAIPLAVFYQHYSFWQVLRFALVGFRLDADTPIQAILIGGGIVSMAKVCSIVLISTAISGLLAGTNALQGIEQLLKSAQSRFAIFLNTVLVGIAASAFGCTQAIGILLTEHLVRQQYATSSKDPTELALDLENTVVVLAPLVPWNIAGLVPATVLMTDWRFIPFAFYLYLIPLVVMLQLWFKPNSMRPSQQNFR
ncbi:MAG: Na+/H+ antiporter NhaC family protein [Leptolyngbya sp. IPPAS B-1204]|nr:MAG: Na+/H+ antiporter NhaC family protein [Leptolyngbya sp. IPPAS B-1204]